MGAHACVLPQAFLVNAFDTQEAAKQLNAAAAAAAADTALAPEAHAASAVAQPGADTGAHGTSLASLVEQARSAQTITSWSCGARS